MSTDMQRYSIDNQCEAIALYAAKRGFTIVRSYEDGAKSGVRLDGRTALQTLLTDVCSGRADFKIILVYDVSRWGRFQDIDESAHYEFLCRRAGVDVEYCAEQFENDGSLTAAILKNIKRAMAGEFSRELSAKVFAGHSRIVMSGYRVCGAAGYGLRRILLDESGDPRMVLKQGQQKFLQAERVILAPGPIEEIRTVRRVYDLFVDHKKRPREIAEQLNAEGYLTAGGRLWTRPTVFELLSNPKYMGASVYNKTSKKLGANWHRNPESEWICKKDAFKPIVSEERFLQAKRQIKENARQLTKNEMLDRLTALWCSRGHLTTKIVDQSRYTQSAHAYDHSFGSLTKAYLLIGFRHHANRGKCSDFRKEMIKHLVEGVKARGGTVEISPWNRQIVVNGEFTINVFVSGLMSKGPRIWRFGYKTKDKPDIVLAGRIGERGGPITDYFVLPFIFMPHGTWITVSTTSGVRLDRFRCDTLDRFYDLCARTKLEEPQW